MSENVFTIVEYDEERVNGLNHVLELRMNGESIYNLAQSPALNEAQLASSREVFMERVKGFVEDFHGVLVRN